MLNQSRTSLIAAEFIYPLNIVMQSKAARIPKVITTAANWFSVREETNIPIAIKLIPTRRIAIVLPRIITKFGGIVELRASFTVYV
jgi:hypothetical protein